MIKMIVDQVRWMLVIKFACYMWEGKLDSEINNAAAVSVSPAMSSRRWLPVVFVVGLPAASFAASPDCPAATLAAAHGCQIPGATVSPNATWAACFSLTDQRASSIGQCVEWCRKKGMTPACIGSAEENDFAASLVPDYDGAWIGHYQIGNNPEPAEGWGRCVAGEASGFANWDKVLGQPNGEHWGLHSDCAGIAGNGGWYDGPCVVPAMIGLTFRCLCKGPSSASDSFVQDLVVLEAAVQADVDNQQARMVPVYGICSVIALLPAVLLCFGELRRRASHSSAKVGAAEEHLKPGSEKSLHAMSRLAAQRRLRVSGVMLQIGWLLFVFGLAPTILNSSIGPIDAVIGFWYFYTVMWHPGVYLMLLAMLSTDARSIKRIAAVHVFVSTGYIVLIILKQTQQLGLEDIVEVCKITLIFVTTAGCVPIFKPRAARFERLLLELLVTWLRLLLRRPTDAPTEEADAMPARPKDAPTEEAYAMPARLGLRRLWLLQRFFSFGMGVLLFSSTVGMLLLRPNLIRHPLVASRLAAAAVFIACSVVCRPTNRGRFRRFLGRLGRRKHTEEEEKAAAISALMGADPTKVLRDAQKLFSCLPVRELTEDDMKGSGLKGDAAEPNKAKIDAGVLAAKTKKAELGDVTAFLSHSWRDEDRAPGQKHKAIQKWARQRQVDKPGEEPTLWLVRLPQHPTCKHAPALKCMAPRCRIRHAYPRTETGETSIGLSPACPSSSRAARFYSFW